MTGMNESTIGLAAGRPEKGTLEYALWIAAIDVAMAAPGSHGPTTTHALVPWAKIEKLRDALEAVGIDWRPRSRREARP